MNSISRCLAWMFAGLLAATALGQGPPPESRLAEEIPADTVRTIQLDNGLRVVLVVDRAEPQVSVQLWYRVGGSADPIERPGLTHLAWLSRMRCPQSPADVGAILADACYAISFGNSDSLDDLLDRHRRWMQPAPVHASSDLKELRKHAEVDAARHGGVTPAVAEQRLRAALFPRHVYGRQASRIDLALNGVTVEELVAHEARWFVTGAAVLIIYGDFEIERAEEGVRSRFGNLPWAEAPPLERERPPPPGPAVLRPLSPTTWELGLRVPPIASPERDALAVLREYLTNPVDGLWSTMAIVAIDDWATTEAGMWRVRVVNPPVPLGWAALGAVSPPPAFFGSTLRSVAESTPDPIRLHRARALATTEAARAELRFADRAALTGAAFALAHGAAINIQPDVSADAVRQVAGALAEQCELRGTGGEPIAASGSSRQAGKSEPDSVDAPEPHSGKSAENSRGFALRPHPALSASLTSPASVEEATGREGARGVAWWKTTRRELGEIELIQTAGCKLAEVEIAPTTEGQPDVKVMTTLLRSATRSRSVMDRLTYHGIRADVPRLQSPPACRWLVPTEALPVFLEALLTPAVAKSVAESHDEQAGQIRVRMRIYADETACRAAREWLETYPAQKD